jgi:hypothetical protein
MPDSPSPATVSASTPPTVPLLPVAPLSKGIGDPLRWAILGELAAGESLMVVEIARKLGKPATLISKHLGVLRTAGVVTIRQRLHFIPKRFIPEPGSRVVDFGHCLIRFGLEAEQ